MGLMDLIDKARELIGGGGGIDGLSEKAGDLSDIAQGEGSVLEKGQQAAESLGEGGDAGDAGEGTKRG
ncbi:MAG: hypothetical protein ACRDL3_10380 [Solirubrobacterales bacterium]